MSNLLLKEKYQLVKTYLNEIDPSFRFITMPLIDPNNIQNQQLKIVHLKSFPTLSYYKIIESDLDYIIDQPFVTNQNLMILAEKYIEGLQIDREVMTYNQKLRSVQVNAHKDLLRIFLEVKNIVLNIEKNITLERKGSFIDLLFTNIKQLNVLISEAQLIYETLCNIEIRCSIDLLHYIGLFSDQQNSKLLIAFNYDENAIQMMDFQDHILQVLSESYNQCQMSTEDAIAAKSAHLALQMKKSLEEGSEYFQTTNCLYNQLCAFIYLEFRRMNFYTREELKKLEPYIAKINKNICEILYLHFIKKRETEKIKDLFAGQVKEIQLGIREPLENRQNMEIVKDIYRRSNQLILELRHCKEVYNLFTGDCFTAFFERKKMKRKNTIKALKNEILLFQQTLTFIEEIIKTDGPLKRQINHSKEFIEKVNKLEITFQDIISKKVIRSKIPQHNTEINKIRSIAKTCYSESEDVIVELKAYEKQFQQYYDISFISIFEHLFENTFNDLKKTLQNLYTIQEKIILILQKESKILGTECTQIHSETEILLKDIYEFLQQVDSNVITRTDNKKFLDDVGSNILKILMRLKKKQAQIEMNLQDKSLIVSHKLSSELQRMSHSLAYQLTNLEGLGIIIESRQNFNSGCIVNSMYEFLEKDPKFQCLDQILQDIPEHKKDVESFIQEYAPRVSYQMRKLAYDRINIEGYFHNNFSEMKQCHLTILQCHQLYQQKYNNQIILFDMNYLNVIGPIINSYQKISNIVIDITTNNVFQEELKKKLRDCINKYINELKTKYATDELHQIHKTTHSLLMFAQIKDKIIQNFQQSMKDAQNNTKDNQELLKYIVVPLGEYFTLIKDMKWISVLQRQKGKTINIINIEEYNSFIQKTEDLEDFFQTISMNAQSLEQQYEDYKINIHEPDSQLELNKNVLEILQDVIVKYKYEFDENIKSMAIQYVTLIQNAFQLQQFASQSQ